MPHGKPVIGQQAERKELTMLFPVKKTAAAGLALAFGLSLSGCATTEYVDEQIATVNNRIGALESKVAQVDSTAQAAAGSAQQANQRIDQLSGRMDGLEQQMVLLRQTPKKPRN
ncbi:hypothetical protein [Novosphingobium sp. G106]|uniref:hypothetical protein n=1 Tax=Novosphingobium sp. G106 TaxID=2849500 RepID=UPI0028114186|nr:hypothetical protein [Novosphingobium sp. G106]